MLKIKREEVAVQQQQQESSRTCEFASKVSLLFSTSAGRLMRDVRQIIPA